jgi:hypothetical protein
MTTTEKEEDSPRVWLKLGAEICGAEVGAVIYGAEMPATYADAVNGGNFLGAVTNGVQTCYLDAVVHGVDLQGPNTDISFLGVRMRI